MPTTFDPSGLLGWVDQPERHALAARHPQFRQIAPACMAASADDDGKKPVLLYKAITDVLGGWDKLPWVPQAIGDCTSFGWGHSNDILQCVELILGADTGDFAETCTEALYGLGREKAGMTGRRFAGDGCYGSALREAALEGMAPRFLLPADRGGATYDGDRARRWGQQGIPTDVREICSRYKLGGSALVRTWAEFVAATRSGYPVAICSNWGGTYKRDADGFLARGWKPWPHCMLLAGVRFDIEGAACLNSWPIGTFSGPVAFDLWQGGYWLRRADVEAILAAGDSYALSMSPDFKPRPLPRRWTYDAAA